MHAQFLLKLFISFIIVRQLILSLGVCVSSYTSLKSYSGTFFINDAILSLSHLAKFLELFSSNILIFNNLNLLQCNVLSSEACPDFFSLGVDFIFKRAINIIIRGRNIFFRIRGISRGEAYVPLIWFIRSIFHLCPTAPHASDCHSMYSNALIYFISRYKQGSILWKIFNLSPTILLRNPKVNWLS